MTRDDQLPDSLQNEVTVTMGSHSQPADDIRENDEQMERLARPGDRRRATRKRDTQGRWA